MLSPVKVAAVHAAPVFLDRAATTEKAISIIREAAKSGAGLIAFPETYIPAFPVWAAMWAPIDNHDLFISMAEQSVSLQGPEINSLRRKRGPSECASRWALVRARAPVLGQCGIATF